MKDIKIIIKAFITSYNIIMKKILLFYLFILIYLFQGPLFNPNLNLAGSDFKLANVHWRQFAAQEIRSGRLPLWNPYINSGQPFLAHPESALFYPPNLLYLFLPASYAMTILIVFHLLLSFLGMQMLALKLTKSRSAGMISGLIYTLSGYFAGTIYAGHLNSIISASLFPITFLMFYEAFLMGKLKNIILASISFSLLILSGFPENVVYFGIVVSLFFIILFSRAEFRKNVASRLVTLFLILLLGTILTSIQLIPAIEYVRQTTRAQGLPYEEAVIFSMTKEELKNLIFPNFYHKYIGSTYPFWGYLNYFGPVAFLLVIIAFMTGLSDVIILALVLIGICGFILSFGSFLPFGIYKVLWETIPVFKLFRIPSHYLLLTIFSVSLLSAYGFKKIKSKYIQAIILIIIAVSSLAFFKPFILTDSNSTYPINRTLASEFNKFDKNYRFFHSYGAYTDWSNLMDLFDPNSAISYRVESVKGSDTLLLKSYADFASIIDGRQIVPFSSRPIDVVIDNATSPLLNLLSTRYFLMLPNETDLAKVDPGRFRLITSTDRFRLYENLTALPHGVILYKAVAPGGRIQIINYLRSREFKYSSEAVVEKDIYPPLAKFLNKETQGQKPTVNIISRQPGKTIYQIRSKAPGILLSGDIYYPGWKARINGETATPVFPVDLALFGVAVPSGNYKLELYFDPDSFKIGAVISFVTGVFMLVVYLLTKLQIRHPRGTRSGHPGGV